MTFQYVSSKDRVIFSPNDKKNSINSNNYDENSFNMLKPGFIRIKLIELDLGPSFKEKSTEGKYSFKKDFDESCFNERLDPYCAVNIKELVKIENFKNEKILKNKDRNVFFFKLKNLNKLITIIIKNLIEEDQQEYSLVQKKPTFYVNL
jgi:hypothetical protein